jgi:hypothetical protein
VLVSSQAQNIWYMCPEAPNYPTYLKVLVLLYSFRPRKLLVEGGPSCRLLLELGGFSGSTSSYGVWRGGEL